MRGPIRPHDEPNAAPRIPPRGRGGALTMSEVNSMAVVGAGAMGSGIAYTAALAGIRAYQIDVLPEQLKRAEAYHQKTAGRAVEKERITQADADAALGRISYHTDLEDARGADWGVEAVIERVDLKKEICRKMLDLFANDAVLATNTSSIAITDIATGAGDHAGRVIGMHFFNPVPVMKLVEVIRGLATSDETFTRTMELAQRLGKTPVPANDRAGFVANRILMPMINEAFYAWMEGVAQPEHIDEIMKLGMAHPMGPLRLADFIGLDVCHNIMMVLYDELGQDKYFPCPLLRQLVQAGRLGDKTGRGVYDYSEGKG
jgi:3-hydroxybutyryl-CoA dehydrogenase